MSIQIKTTQIILQTHQKKTLTPISPDKVEDIVKILNLRKSNGPNSIPTNLKKYSKTITIPISQLIPIFCNWNLSGTFKTYKCDSNFQNSGSSGIHQLSTHITNRKYQ